MPLRSRRSPTPRWIPTCAARRCTSTGSFSAYPPDLGLIEVPRQVELPLNDAPPIAALSYTQVDTYLRCPQMYQYRFVFRLPTRSRADRSAAPGRAAAQRCPSDRGALLHPGGYLPALPADVPVPVRFPLTHPISG